MKISRQMFDPFYCLMRFFANDFQNKISPDLIVLSCFLITSFFLTIPANLSARQASVINPTVYSPVADGIQMIVPDELGNRPLAQMGFVDITAKPFGADPTGKKDSTNAIQNAINFARDRQMVCFFPSGNYLISDTLNCIQNNYLRTSGAIVGGRKFPCLLIGSRKSLPIRPKLILKNNSPGFGDPKKPKYAVHFWARSKKNWQEPQPNISFNQMFIGIDIEIGKNNPGAVAIRHRAAQGSAIQDCNINAWQGLTGIEGGIGSGGSLTNITISGGKIGLDLRETQPAPTITGITLIQQEQTAILYGGRQSLSAVGLKIVVSGSGPAIKGLSAGYRPATGQISLVDSEILFDKPGGTAISAAKSLYINNVYIKNSGKAVSNPDGSEIKGNKDGWLQVVEYAHGVQPKKWKGYQYTAPVYLNGFKLDKDLIEIKRDVAPPKDLQSRHVWQTDFSNWESPEAVNIKLPPYNAKGDSVEDDTMAIQKAIDENAIIFLPKGYYRISRTLKLRPESKLVGVGRHLSIIMARPPSAAFMNPDKPVPLVETANISNGSTVVAFCCLYTPNALQGLFALNWRSGGASILRSVNFDSQPIKGYISSGKQKNIKTKNVLVSGHGGGKWYNFFKEGIVSENSDYRHLLIKETPGPFAIYQCNLEHAQSDVNMEIYQASNISIFGLKSEGNQPVLKVDNSSNIRIFGYGGNATGLAGHTLFEIKNSMNFILVNLVDTPRVTEGKVKWKGYGHGVDPNQWHMIEETCVNHKIIMTKPLERPVLYKRDNQKER